ncbi:hypothetical protein ASG31_17090 [Chryseobacterium sp. Leaf404]|uniref:DUF4269 domain-containing protein n=1 Tax=unclassified Chryseobacterium TaxID=2593645 RepID=UPI0006FE6922|nr:MULTISPECIES: DUF4269 domain-containing protein [unclassified Chryseobacterium]KQT20893.1 hypothetical protein ASG31_17090 [Chryseobacterium sp. Leaf404]
MIDFTKPDYLKTGNEKQKRVFEVLIKYRIFERLKGYYPILAGTIPIEIDIKGSDLDIICEVKDQVEFKNFLNKTFSEFDLNIETIVINGTTSVVCNFKIEEFPVEIFGQNKQTTQQNAFLHMIAQHKILMEKGEEFKQKIIDLKKKGIKTEPAFGALLNLENPYEDLLKF